MNGAERAGEGKELSTAQHSRITRGWHWLSRWFGERGWYWFAGYLFAVGSIGNNGIQIESPWYAAGSVLVVFYIGYAFGRVFEQQQNEEKREKREWIKANTRTKTREELEGEKP